MENNGLVITVNLPGRIGGSVSHTSSQTVKVDVSSEGSKRAILVDANINHTDRPMQDCYRKINISPEVLESWVGNKAPYFVKPQDWQRYDRARKIIAHVSTFDEGFGVDYLEM